MTDEVLNQSAQGQLRSIVERAERLDADKAEVTEAQKQLFQEAAGAGYDVKVIRKVIRIRKQDRAKRMEEDSILDLYLSATGDLL